MIAHITSSTSLHSYPHTGVVTFYRLVEDLNLQDRLASARAIAASVSEAPISELLRRIDRVTAHFDMDDIRDPQMASEAQRALRFCMVFLFIIVNFSQLLD